MTKELCVSSTPNSIRGGGRSGTRGGSPNDTRGGSPSSTSNPAPFAASTPPASPASPAPIAPIADVLVAMSGGVDSTVAALLLARAGYDVAGVTMKLFDNELIGEGQVSKCCSLEDVADAQSACRALGIEHFTFNFKERFRRDVVERFCASYLAGRTPNPCIDCNRYLKFAGLQQRRRELGATYVATGHYARRVFDEHAGTWQLLRAADAHKDQSYVLYHLTQDDLAHMLFPLGDLTKAQVRALAHEAGFDNADKQESQDICFVPDGDYAAFIERMVRERETGAQGETDARGEADAQGDVGAAFLMQPGAIVDVHGAQLGTHRGLAHYTIGQRKGIGIASSEPLYVLAKRAATNELVVAARAELSVKSVALVDVNVISGKQTPTTCEATIKTSYRQQPVPGAIEFASDGTARVQFREPTIRPAPGQSVVAYAGERVIGGGVVAETEV